MSEREAPPERTPEPTQTTQAADATATAHPARQPGRALRRAGGTLLAILIAAAGVIGLLLFFESRDNSNIRPPSAESGPGQVYPDQGSARLAPGQQPPQPYNSNPPTSGPHVPTPIRSDAPGTEITADQLLSATAAGDVVILYGTRRPPAALTQLQQQIAGPFDPALATAGQAIVLARAGGVNGAVGVAWRHLLAVRDPADPALASFATYWLGRGASG